MKLATIRSVRSASLKLRLSLAALCVLTSGFSGCATTRDYSPAERADSAALRGRVVDRLAHDSTLQPLVPLSVQTRNQVVYLYGTVSTDMQRDLAGSVAAETAGVHGVENLIAVVE
jgi:osmotically-inducible protein OsmY